MNIEFMSKLLALGTVLGQLFIVAAVGHLLFFRGANRGFPEIKRLFSWMAEHAIAITFAVAAIATSGSLFYSQVAGFPPCELCWYQRIFMYPLVAMLLFALIKKDRAVIDYAFMLAVIGGIIALFHNYMYYSQGGLQAICEFAGVSGVSCIQRYIFEFDYITIPLMSLTAFGMIIVTLLTAKLVKNEKH